MRRKIFTGALVFLLIISIGSILYLNRVKISLQTEKPNPDDFTNVIEANNQFAFDYYSKLKNTDDGNIFFSPFSISSAFAMAYEGARGQTANEIRSVFYFPTDNDLRRSQYASVFSEINKPGKKYKLSTANALWAQQDYQFSKDYFNNVERYYGGKVTNLDFKNNAERSRVTINKWVEEQTNNKIKNLIPSGVINQITKLILTNAIYFKCEWDITFDKNDTKEENFRTNKKSTIKTQMMRFENSDVIFNYAENSSLQILEMPYSGEELSMLILLPKKDSLEKLEGMLNSKNLADWKKDFEKQRVKVYIPRFKFETKYFMSNDLRAMGMPLSFSDSADFSGMIGNQKLKDEGLKINEAVHQAFVEVNEEETEATAATAIVVEIGAAGPQKEPKTPIFRADHPFIFLIQQKSSGNILFIGRVVDPNKS